MTTSPYVSLIVVARNDNYGGDFLYRLEVFVSSLAFLCAKHRLAAELIVVEWNPPVDRPFLQDALSWEKYASQYLAVRIIQVPPEIHASLPNPAKLHLFEYLGKNVGVRRARGEYILTTNPDVIFNSELVQFLSQRRLRPDCFYRIDRYDVRSPVPLETTVDESCAFCRNNILRRMGRLGVYGNGNLGMYDPRRWKSWAVYLKNRVTRYPHDYPHINASGDFFLSYGDNWTRLRGYPEIETQGKPHGIDGLIVHSAQWIGLKQTILSEPLRLYHQDHGRPETSKPFSPTVKELYQRMKATKSASIINNDDWGLAGHDLFELENGATSHSTRGIT